MEILTREMIFPEGAYFPQCHASTLAVLPDGSVAAAWFAGEAEGRDDVAIWGARRTAEGWSEPRVLADFPGEPCWNPVLRHRGGGDVTLYYKAGKTIPAWRTYAAESTDGGASFGPGRELVPGDAGGRGPVKNKGIDLPDGTYLAPMSVETDTAWRAGVDITRDGVTWDTAPVPIDASSLAGKGIIQPTLWTADGVRIHMLLRSTEGCIYRSLSADGGRTWAEARPTSLPHNNSGLDAVRMDDGRVALVCNPVPGNWAARTPLTLFVSVDGGESFEAVLELENTPGEYSYPAIVAEGDTLHITYTHNRRTVAYCRVRP